MIVLSRDIIGTRKDGSRVYLWALLQKPSLSLSEDQHSPCPMANIPGVTILWHRKDSLGRYQ